MATSNLGIRYRPVRIGLLARQGETDDLVRAASICSLLWGGTVGDAAIVATTARFAMGQDVCLIRSVEQHPKYLLYLLLSEPLAQQLESFMVGATFRRINVGQIKTFWACWPPAREQQAIADFLDREIAKIDKMVAKVETAIEHLQEYRNALITAAVTGKIDVRTESTQ